MVMQDRLIEESFSKYKEYLTAVIKAVCRDISDADVDDILSDVYLKLCRTSQMYDEDKASVKTYLSYIARNAAIDFCRKSKAADENIDEHVELRTDEDMDEYILQAEVLPTPAQISICFLKMGGLFSHSIRMSLKKLLITRNGRTTVRDFLFRWRRIGGMWIMVSNVPNMIIYLTFTEQKYPRGLNGYVMSR